MKEVRKKNDGAAWRAERLGIKAILLLLLALAVCVSAPSLAELPRLFAREIAKTPRRINRPPAELPLMSVAVPEGTKYSVTRKTRREGTDFFKRGTAMDVEDTLFTVPEIGFTWSIQRKYPAMAMARTIPSGIYPMGVFVSEDRTAVALVVNENDMDTNVFYFVHKGISGWDLVIDQAIHNSSSRIEGLTFLPVPDEILRDIKRKTRPSVAIAAEVKDIDVPRFTIVWLLTPEGIQELSKEMIDRL